MMASLLRGCVMQRLAPGSAALAAAQRALPAGVASRSHMLASSSNRHRPLTTTAAAATDLSTAAAGEDPLAASGQRPPKIFTAWTVYKGRGALSVKPVPPQWSMLPGREPNDPPAYKLDKEGGLMFELANALGERRYDWDKKVVIQLRPEELAQLMSDPSQEHSLYHDTFKNTPGREGVLTKTLKWSQAPDGKGYFINASSNNKDDGSRNSVSISLTKAEFYILQRLVDYSFGPMYGYDAAFMRY